MSRKDSITPQDIREILKIYILSGQTLQELQMTAFISWFHGNSRCCYLVYKCQCVCAVGSQWSTQYNHNTWKACWPEYPSRFKLEEHLRHNDWVEKARHFCAKTQSSTKWKNQQVCGSGILDFRIWILSMVWILRKSVALRQQGAKQNAVVEDQPYRPKSWEVEIQVAFWSGISIWCSSVPTSASIQASCSTDSVAGAIKIEKCLEAGPKIVENDGTFTGNLSKWTLLIQSSPWFQNFTRSMVAF